MEWNFRNDNAYHVATAAWLLIMFPDMSNLIDILVIHISPYHYSPPTEHRPYKLSQAFRGKSLLS